MSLLKTRPKPAPVGKSITLQIDDNLRARLNSVLDAAYQQNREFDVPELLQEYLRRVVPTVERELGLTVKPEAPSPATVASVG